MNSAARSPTLADLEAAIADVMRTRGGIGGMSLLPSSENVADDLLKALIRDAAGRPSAVVLCSSRASAELALRGVERARSAKSMLGPELGAPVLREWATGYVDGLTYAVWPYRGPIARTSLDWRIKRRGLRRRMLSWLRAVTAATAAEPTSDELRQSFESPLRHIQSRGWRRAGIGDAARRAADRLSQGTWRPRFVLEHNDLWRGNLLRAKRGDDDPSHWGFVVIDWPGAKMRGHAFYDLLRVAPDLGMSRDMLSREVAEHCRLLGCDGPDALGYLLSGLGYLGLNLDHFPEDRYAALVEDLYDVMETVLLTRSGIPAGQARLS